MPATVTSWGDAVFLSLSNALNSFLAAIPLVIGALLIIVIGWIIAGVLARLVTEVLAGRRRSPVRRARRQVYGDAEPEDQAERGRR